MFNLFNAKKFNIGLLMTTAIFISGCSDSNNKPKKNVDGEFRAVIASASFTSGSSEISIANTVLKDDVDTPDIDESLESYDIVNGYAAQDISDISVATFGKYFYRIGRYMQDNITKYSFANPNQPVWQFSVKGDGEPSSNPQDIIFVNNTKAYVLRYDASSIWVVNPNVAHNDEDNFKTQEIDLSAYAAGVGDTVPEMKAGVIHQGTLYVVLQNMVNWNPDIASLVMIDVASNTVIGEKALTVKNPIDLDLQGDYLYVSGVGQYEYGATPAGYTGGIEKINLVDGNYSSQLLVDDGDDTSHPYGQINGLTLISETLGYFQGYAGWGSLDLYQFNPSTGVVESDPVSGFDGLDIRFAEASPEGQLWVGLGDTTYPEIKVIDPSDNSLVETLSTDKNPSVIVFSDNLSD